MHYKNKYITLILISQIFDRNFEYDADLLKEGIFDFFSKKVTEDDKIALSYIKRLKKVKGISPYKITKDDTTNGDSYIIDKWMVDFEDTPIKLWAIVSTEYSGFGQESQELLIVKNVQNIVNMNSMR